MTLFGTSGAVELPPILDRDDNLRWTTTRRWRGLRDDLVTIADSQAGKSRISQEDGVWHLLEVTFAGLYLPEGAAPNPDDQVVSVYEIDYARIERSLWLRPDIQAQLQKITLGADRGQFRAWVDGLAKGEFVYRVNSDGRPTGTLISIADVDAAVTQYQMNSVVIGNLLLSLAAGEDTWTFELPVLKCQTVAPPNASLRAPLGGLNQVIGTAGLLARFPDMPVMYKDSISNDLGNGVWRINAPRLKTMDATRVQLEQTFDFAPDYNAFIYGTPLTQ